MDENEDSLALDFVSSCRYREQVLRHTRYWLGLDPVPDQRSVIAKAASWLLPTSKEKILAPYFLSYLGLKSESEPPYPNSLCVALEGFGRLAQSAHSQGIRTECPR